VSFAALISFPAEEVAVLGAAGNVVSTFSMSASLSSPTFPATSVTLDVMDCDAPSAISPLSIAKTT